MQSMVLRSQSEYKVDTFTVVYDTLTDYNSLVKENILAQEWFFLFDKEFDLGFDFPFFEKSFDKISFSSYGLGLFVEDLGPFNIYTLDNDWDICDEPTSLSKIKYDYRYKFETVNNKKVFKLEWRNVCLYRDGNMVKRSFNFQTWLWENGDLDVRIGSMLRGDTSVFIPGFGFNSGYNAGNIGLINTDDTKAIFYSGDYKYPNIQQGHPDDLLTIDNKVNITTLPHEGFVIRFKKQTSSLSETKLLKKFPNVIVDILSIPTDFSFSEYRIFDMSGREIKKGIDREIDLSFLQNGYYVIKLRDGAGIYSYKFVKQ
jgi:hypothetical protein